MRLEPVSHANPRPFERVERGLYSTNLWVFFTIQDLCIVCPRVLPFEPRNKVREMLDKAEGQVHSEPLGI